MNDFDKIENMHKNDKGMEVGDRVLYMANDWMPVECVLEEKDGAGFTRKFRLRMLDERLGGRSLFRANSWDNDHFWMYRFVTNPKKVMPLPEGARTLFPEE